MFCRARRLLPSKRHTASKSLIPSTGIFTSINEVVYELVLSLFPSKPHYACIPGVLCRILSNTKADKNNKHISELLHQLLQRFVTDDRFKVVIGYEDAYFDYGKRYVRTAFSTSLSAAIPAVYLYTRSLMELQLDSAYTYFVSDIMRTPLHDKNQPFVLTIDNLWSNYRQQCRMTFETVYSAHQKLHELPG